MTGPVEEISVATYLPPAMEARVRTAVSPSDVRPSQSVVDFCARAACAADIGVLQPRLVRSADVLGLALDAHVPLLGYLRPSLEDARAAVALARDIPIELVVFDHGDDADALRERLENVRRSSMGRHLCTLLQDRLSLLPALIRDGITAFCCTGTRARSVHALATKCCVSEMTLARHLASVGIRRPHKLVIAAALARISLAVLDPAVSVAELARMADVASAQTLNRQLGDLIGCSVQRARARGMTPAQFVELCAAGLADRRSASQKTINPSRRALPGSRSAHHPRARLFRPVASTG